jgi:hypothetical protein
MIDMATDDVERIARNILSLADPKNAEVPEIVPCYFPESIDWTPDHSACQDPGHIHPLKAEDWKRDTWIYLAFAPDAPFPYQIRVTRISHENGAEFRIEARLAPDCNGQPILIGKSIRMKMLTPPSSCELKAGETTMDGDIPRKQDPLSLFAYSSDHLSMLAKPVVQEFLFVTGELLSLVKVKNENPNSAEAAEAVKKRLEDLGKFHKKLSAYRGELSQVEWRSFFQVFYLSTSFRYNEMESVFPGFTEKNLGSFLKDME